MLLPLNIDTTSAGAPLTNPSSANLLMLMMITGGLLVICIILLVIVVLRSKAKKKKLQSASVEQPSKQEVKKQPEPKKEKRTDKKAVDLPVAKEENALVKSEEKKVVEIVVAKTEVVVPPVIKEELPEVKKQEVTEPIVSLPEVKEDKKPDEVIIHETPVIKTKEIIPDPYATSEESKKENIRKAIEETHSKEDNLKKLQERLNELAREKTTEVKVVPAAEQNHSEIIAKEEIITEPAKEEHLIDLTATILGEKNETRVEDTIAENVETPMKEEVKEEVVLKVEEEKEAMVMEEKMIFEPDVLPAEEINPAKEPVVSEEMEAKQDVSVLTPFMENLEQMEKENAEEAIHMETPEELIDQINAELANTSAETEVEESFDKTTQPITSDMPKTFTEWLNTMGGKNKK